MLKNLEGLPADHPMRDFMTPLYHLSDQHHDQDPNMLLYPGHHHDNGLNLSDSFHAMNSVNYMQNMGKNPMHSMFNLQDMVTGGQLHDKNSALNLPLNSEIPQATVDKKEDCDEEDGEDESGDDSPNKKRGKYKTYTDEEKAQILTLATKHGIEKTLDLFSEGEHKLTKRKLRSWLESQDKVKGVKGRKSNEPNRDAHLYEWYVSFQNEHSRPPTRKEATKRALEITDDPKFQASKGWLDKFSRKFQVEFTPLKIVPPKMLKKGPLEEDLSTATTMGSAALAALVTADTDLSPKTAGKKLKLDKLHARKIQSAPIQEKDEPFKPDATKFSAGSAFKNTLSQTPHDSQHQGFHPPTHFKAPAQSFTTPTSNPLGDASLVPKNPAVDPTLDQNKSQSGYPAMPFYPMDYSMYNPFPYHQGVYPNMPNYPSLNYPMNMPMSYPPGFAENFQRLQQAMKKDNDPTKGDKPN